MPQYRFKYSQACIDRRDYLRFGDILVEAENEEHAREYVNNLIEDGLLDLDNLNFEVNTFAETPVETDYAGVCLDAVVLDISNAPADYVAPQREVLESEEAPEEEDEEVEEDKAATQVRQISSFWDPPGSGWWKDKYSDSYVFDLAIPEDRDFLCNKGIAAVVTEYGVVQLQSWEQWKARSKNEPQE